MKRFLKIASVVVATATLAWQIGTSCGVSVASSEVTQEGQEAPPASNAGERDSPGRSWQDVAVILGPALLLYLGVALWDFMDALKIKWSHRPED